MLEVLRGHRAAPRAQRDRAADLRVLDLLAVDAARGGPPVLDPGHVRDRALQDADRPRREVPVPTAPREVGIDPDPGTLRGDRAVLAHRPVRLADRRPERDLARDRVEDEMAVVRPGVGEVRDLDPFLPAGLVIGRSPGTTGRCRTPNRPPATPSAAPRISSMITSAWTAAAVPPTVAASRPRTFGEDE